jgi:hypothetical protein
VIATLDGPEKGRFPTLVDPFNDPGFHQAPQQTGRSRFRPSKKATQVVGDDRTAINDVAEQFLLEVIQRTVTHWITPCFHAYNVLSEHGENATRLWHFRDIR